ncbi:MAG: nitroreductase family protein [Thermoguttaceae bacterium]
MPKIIVDKSSCVPCGLCVLTCPNGLFVRPTEDSTPELLLGAEELCIKCAHCVAACPVGAIQIDDITQTQCHSIPRTSLPRFEHVATLVRTRRSIRHFREKLLTRAEIEQLLDVVRWAPSARNRLPLKWIVVHGPDKVHELGQVMVDWMQDKEPFQRQVAAWNEGKDLILRSAPVLIVAYSDEKDDWGDVDGAIAVQSLDYCAVAKRYATCWAGYFIRAAQNDPKTQDWLGLKKGEKVRGALMIGYPGEETYNRIPHRKEATTSWIE